MIKPIESVLIAGAGAIGLLAADSLYRYDRACVSILASGERFERYRRDGLWINGSRVDFALTGDTKTPEKYPDLIIAACKNYHLERLIADMKNFVGPGTIIISLLNGIASEELIGAVYGRERLPLAMIVSTDAQNAGGKVTFTQRGFINFGDGAGKAAGQKERGRDGAVAEFFTRAGIPFKYHEDDMKRALWYKFMVNVGANQTSALLRLPYGVFKKGGPMEVREAGEILESAMREVIAISRAEGINLDDSDIDAWYAAMRALGDNSYTSLCQDVMAGRKTEVDVFSGTVIAYGKKHGIPTPVNELLYRAIKTIEKRAAAAV
ncbi:MAG: ketopantoate reductase family protein [Treponema sp.]|jgi:2-dehydropantoate 2-reductase|nr:ketopantoate reductase family protein [Treponema sp.]